MDKDTERLYNLLPAIYRIRDAKEGEPLRALLAVIERELKDIETDIEGLYDNWFIETCDEWVVPYIGDLLKVRGIRSLETGAFSQRAFVANTLTYRRGKGTAAVLEQLAFDITRWPARVVEFFQLIATTQNLNHLRPNNTRTPDFRDTVNLELLDSPFERTAHSVDVRNIADSRGRYNIPNIGIFLWRLQSYQVKRSNARKAASDGCYYFNPLGLDMNLFNIRRAETEISHIAEEFNVPGKLRRRTLYEELEAYRKALEENKECNLVYFDKKKPVFEIFLDGKKEPLPLEKILICDLEDWRRPPPNMVAVDPVRGRLTLPEGVLYDDMRVSYAYGFSGDIGGGPYPRQDSVETWLDRGSRAVTWQKGVAKDAPAEKNLASTLQEAVEEWNNYARGKSDAFGIITVRDSSTYQENLTEYAGYRIEIPAGCRLAIVASDWTETDAKGSPGEKFGQLDPKDYHPHLRGNISVIGTAAESNPGELILDGLLIEGKLTVLKGNLGSLLVSHCTLVPSKRGLSVNSSSSSDMKFEDNAQLCISMDHCICGPIIVPDIVRKLSINDTIIDHRSGNALAAHSSDKEHGPPTSLERTTVFGKVYVRELFASEVIFTELVMAERLQEGCVRFSYVPDEHSKTPRRYRCLSASKEDGTRLKPVFKAIDYGNPGYAQFSPKCPGDIRTGAEDGSEMGVFCSLRQPQREAVLRMSLEEYLGFGLEAGIFYVT